MKKELEDKFEKFARDYWVGSTIADTGEMQVAVLLDPLKAFIDEHFVEKENEFMTWRLQDVIELMNNPIYTKEQVLEMIGEDKVESYAFAGKPNKEVAKAHTDYVKAYNQAKQEIRAKLN